MHDASNHDDGTATQLRSAFDRRSVLRGIGAIGVGSALLGTASADEHGSDGQGGDGNGQGGDGDDQGEDPDDRGNGRGDRELPIGSQLWTYNESDLSVAELVELHGEAGYDIFEPYFIDDADAIESAMEETGVEMPTAHVGDLQDDVEGAVETYERFGTEVLVLPSGGDWESEEGIVEWAETVSDLADQVDECSGGEMAVGYHNHDHEFETFDDTFGYDIFAEHVSDDVHLQLDVAWAWVGGANPIALLDRYADRVGSLHMKDAVESEDGHELVEIGEGDVPLPAIATLAWASTDVEYLLYEYDGSPTPEESLFHAAEYLERWNGPGDRGQGRS